MYTTNELVRKLKETGTLIVDVKVIPRASRSEVAGTLADGTLKIKVAAVPENGKANAEVCRVVAACFGVPERNVNVLTGTTSTRKRLSIEL